MAIDDQNLDNLPPQVPDELPPEPEEQQPDLADRLQQADNLRSTAEDTRDFFKKRVGSKAERAGQQGLKEGVEKQGVEQAKRRVATHAEKQLSKQIAGKAAQIGGRIAVQAGTEAVTTAGAAAAGTAAAGAGVAAGTAAGAAAGTAVPVPIVGTIIGAIAGFLAANAKSIGRWVKNDGWKWIAYPLAAILVLVAIPFALLAGKELPIYPSTDGQRQGAAVAAVVAGSNIFDSTVTQATVKTERDRYIKVQANVDRTVPNRSAEVKTKIQEILSLEDQAVTIHGQAKKTLVTTINTKVKNLDDSLPFGQWIAEFALSRVGHPSQEFCSITKVSANVGCASFVTTVLQNAGVKIPINGSVDAVWLMSSLRTVVDRPAQESSSYFDQNKNKLQLGDIIFWGSGSDKPGRSQLFNHIGFYVGDGKAVDNSSKTATIRKPTQAAKRSSNGLYFNGAKRYGANL